MIPFESAYPVNELWQSLAGGPIHKLVGLVLGLVPRYHIQGLALLNQVPIEASVLLVIVMADGGQFRVPLEGGQ